MKKDHDKLIQEFRKKFVRSDGEVDEYAEDLEAFLIEKVEEARQEVAKEIADVLAHFPIHGDIELMSREIKGFRKEVLERYKPLINSLTTK
jgi:hypothetical protein